MENVGQIQTSVEEPADEMGQRHWLREGMLATVLLGIGQGSALLSLLLISRLISPAEFGRLSAGLALQNYLVLLGTLGLRTLVVRELARSPLRLPQIWGTYWSMVGPVGALVALGGHLIAGWIFDRDPVEATMSLWLACGAWFSMLSVVPLLDGLRRQVLALGIVALTEGLFVAGVLTQLIPLNLAGLGAAFAIKWTLASVLQASALYRSSLRQRLTYSRDLVDSWRPSIPPLLGTSLIVSLPLTAAVLLARHGLGERDAGIIGLGAQLAAAVILLGGVAVRFLQTLWPDTAALQRSQTSGHFNRIAFTGIVVWMIGCVVVGVVVKWFLRTEYGEELIAILLLVTAGSLGVAARVLWIALLALNDDQGVLFVYACGGCVFSTFVMKCWTYRDVNVIALATVIGIGTTVVFALRRVRKALGTRAET